MFKVKFALERATKAQKGSRGIAVMSVTFPYNMTQDKYRLAYCVTYKNCCGGVETIASPLAVRKNDNFSWILIICILLSLK